MAEKRKPTAWQEVGRYTHISSQFIITVLALTLGGLWLDRKWDTAPWLLLAGLAVGFPVALYNLYREATKDGRR